MTLAANRPEQATVGTADASWLETRPSADAVQTRKAIPIKWWGGLGAACIGLIIYCWTDWLAVGDAHRTPTSNPDGTPGDKAPSWMVPVDRIFEGVVIAILAFTVYFFGYRQWKIQRKITLDGLLILAMTSVYMLQDPWENYTAPAYSYNDRFFNLGCPQCHVPGWMSPGGRGQYQFVEPLLFIGLMYGGVLVLGMVATCAVMRRAKQKWPAIGTPGLIGVGLAFGLVLDLALELPAQHGGGWVWWFGADNGWTLFYGHFYQLPIAEWILWGSCWASMGMLRYFVNDKGETIAERGMDRLKVTGWKKSALRLAALCGALNLMMLVMYNIPYNYIGAHSGNCISDICSKSYFNDGMAGDGTRYKTPGPDTPLFKQGGLSINNAGQIVDQDYHVLAPAAGK